MWIQLLFGLVAVPTPADTWVYYSQWMYLHLEGIWLSSHKLLTPGFPSSIGSTRSTGSAWRPKPPCRGALGAATPSRRRCLSAAACVLFFRCSVNLLIILFENTVWITFSTPVLTDREDISVALFQIDCPPTRKKIERWSAQPKCLTWFVRCNICAA